MDGCDHRMYMTVNADGFTTQAEERVTELVTPLEGAETVSLTYHLCLHVHVNEEDIAEC
jgi:hypothetical protein